MQRQQAVQFNVPNGRSMEVQTVTLPDYFNLPFRPEGMPATLLPSASCSLKHTVSAPARKPLRIFRYVLSVSMNYFIPGSTSH